MLDPSAFALINTASRNIRTKGENYAANLDFVYKLSKKTKLSVGTRYYTIDFDTREAGANTNDFGGYTDEQREEYIRLRTGEDNLTDAGFLGGDIGLPQWIAVPGRAVLDMTPEFAALDGGSVFDFDTPIKDVMSEDGDLQFFPGRSYSAAETKISTYAQVDTETKLFNVPLILNFGVRAVNTQNEGRAFTGVSQRDPIEGTISTVDAAFYHETTNSRWDVLPSFNANFKIKKNFYYRISAARGLSSPRYRDMIPNNDVQYLDPASAILDPNSPEFIEDLETSVYRGTIVSGNAELKPYTAWMYDNTFELYSKNGGSFRASIFYKDIKDYIGRESTVDQPYPAEAVGVPLPEGQENLLFDISKPVNITNARLYGLEVGFNQHFTFLPGFAKGFGLKANYSLVESEFDGAVGDATNGFPGTSKHNFNATMYYEKYGASVRFTVAHRTNYLSNLGGVGSLVTRFF